jgi:hypothetical protein
MISLGGSQTTEESRALFEDLAVYPHLQHKLRLFVRDFRRGPIADILNCQVTAASSLFLVEKNLSKIFRKQLRHQLHKKIDMPPSYSTRQRDGLVLPQKDTFLNAYKVLSLSLLPSKTKETTFQALSRTVWTQNKAFKSGIASDVMKQKPWSTSSTVVKITLQRSGLLLGGYSCLRSRDILGISSLGLSSLHWKSSSRSRIPQFFSTFQTGPPGKFLSSFSRK